MREQLDRHPKTRQLRAVTHFIRQWRKHHRMTVEQVANAAGLTASMISQLEIGRSAYTQNSLEAVAKALRVEPWQLLCCDPSSDGHLLHLRLPRSVFLAFAEQDRPKLRTLLEAANALLHHDTPADDRAG